MNMCFHFPVAPKTLKEKWKENCIYKKKHVKKYEIVDDIRNNWSFSFRKIKLIKKFEGTNKQLIE